MEDVKALRTLMEFDPEVAQAIELEKGRQENKLEVIASENFVTYVVMEAMGTVLINKYAEHEATPAP